ncbi:Uncharacterised protein [Halioglobus japonicus]|nr:Uncharacterised protein [Halioglobus japonicus]
MKDDINTGDGGQHSEPDMADPLAFPTLAYDVDKYRAALPEGEIPEEEAQAYLEALWHIMHTLVDMGMDLNPAHSLIDHPSEKTGTDSEKSVQQTVSPSFNQRGSREAKQEKEKADE